MPLFPYFWNLNMDGNAAPVLRSVFRFSVGSDFPAHLASAGFGSKVSTCVAPPFAKMWMIRFALALKWGRRGVSGFRPPVASCASSSGPALPSRLESASAPIPMPQR